MTETPEQAEARIQTAIKYSLLNKNPVSAWGGVGGCVLPLLVLILVAVLL